MRRIAAVVVTFNRKTLLKECLDALLAQTTPLDKILVIDNASSDGTPEFLAGCGHLENRSIEYIRLPVNTGGAGGFYEGVKRAHLQGFDWIWIMDDDAEPKPDALEALSYYFSKHVSAVCSLLTDADGYTESNYKHRGWFKFSIRDDRVIDSINKDDIRNDSLLIEHCSFVGMAVQSSAINEAGYPDPRFFIHYDDVEYCLRLSAVAPLILVTKSKITHKEAATLEKNEQIVRLMGRKSTRIPIDRLWITYYGNRNRIWLKTKMRGKLLGSVYAIKWVARRCVGVLLYDDKKIRRIRFHIHAFLDGIRGNFDNDKPKSLLKLQETKGA